VLSPCRDLSSQPKSRICVASEVTRHKTGDPHPSKGIQPLIVSSVGEYYTLDTHSNDSNEGDRASCTIFDPRSRHLVISHLRLDWPVPRCGAVSNPQNHAYSGLFTSLSEVPLSWKSLRDLAPQVAAVLIAYGLVVPGGRLRLVRQTGNAGMH
jgi:hypothetical protein